MTASACLFCNGNEGSYRPPAHTDFVCSRCVILLLDAEQADLRRAYNKAIRLDLPRKAKAVRKFIEEEIIDRCETKYQRPAQRISPLRMAGVGSP